MKFLANENFPFPGIVLLRESGFQVTSIAEANPGITDTEVISLALKHDLVILTLDKDYGELIFRYAIQKPPSVIYFRDKGVDPKFAGSVLLRLLSERTIAFENCFTVISSDKIRQRRYK